MPELPEVQTTVSILNKKLKGLKILDVWTDYDSTFYHRKNDIKNKKYFPVFKKQVLGMKILGSTRRAKNVLIHLSDPFDKLRAGKTILVHMKMTGHLLYGKYTYKKGKWLPPETGLLADPYNRFIHLAFTLSPRLSRQNSRQVGSGQANRKQLVLSDARKFAKVLVFNTDTMNEFPDLKKLGPEPLEKEFTFLVFKERILKKPKGKIKTVLMDQELIAGIGNIYSDEALWMTGIHPLTLVKKLNDTMLKALYKNILKVLKKSISVGGDSKSDYRDPNGRKGGYHKIEQVYGREGEKCKLNGCIGIIKRIKVGGRSAHFCDCHQK